MYMIMRFFFGAAGVAIGYLGILVWLYENEDIAPVTVPQVKTIKGHITFKIGIVADLDKERSVSPGKKLEWRSYLTTGYLTAFENGRYEVNFTETHTLTTNLNENGRALELSELCVFNGKVYTVDDRTGVVYQIIENEAIPWVILTDGDGRTNKGFKSEWMTVKDGVLYVGSSGKEWTTKSGATVNRYPMFVKAITKNGEVAHRNWTNVYLKIRKRLGVSDPGYVWHEAAMWSNKKNRWFFLPRRMSLLKYDDHLDERRGTNVLISATSKFTDMNVVFVGKRDRTHGFSSFKFVPGTNDDVAIAVKSKEVDGDISSYVMVFDVNSGEVLMDEQLIGYEKYEGIEFL